MPRRAAKADCLNQSGWSNQPHLEEILSADEENRPLFRCLLCSGENGNDRNSDSPTLSVDEVALHLLSASHRRMVKETVRQALPTLRDESCLDGPLSLPFCRMGHNPDHANRVEFTCLTCRTKGMPLGVFLTHCQSFRHTSKHREACEGLGVGNTVDSESLLSSGSLCSPLPTSPSVISPVLRNALIQQPYLAQQEPQKGVFVWECLLCHVSELQSTDDLVLHLQTPDHLRRQNDLFTSESQSVIETEKNTLSNGREEYRCKLCGTNTMLLERLGSHYNGMRHRQAFRQVRGTAQNSIDLNDDARTAREPHRTGEKTLSGSETAVDELAAHKAASLPGLASLTQFDSAALPTLSSTDIANGTHYPPPPPAPHLGAEAMNVLAKVEICRALQVQIAPLPDFQKHHVNHLLLQHVLCDEEPTQGVFLSLATVYVNDYLSQLPTNRTVGADRRQPPEPGGAFTLPPLAETSNLHEGGSDASMSNFRKHLPKDSYLSPTVMKSIASVDFDDDADLPAVTLDFRSSQPKDLPSASSAAPSAPSTASTATGTDAWRMVTSNPSAATPKVFDSPYRPRKKRSTQECFPCCIL
jgi:hypothetical protein